MEPKPFQPNIVNILGEVVALTETGLSNAQKAIRRFEKYYRPEDMNNEDFEHLIRVIRMVFGGRPVPTMDVKTQTELPNETTLPYPPCDDMEKELVLTSLLYRKQLLRQELAQKGFVSDEELAKRLKEEEQSIKPMELQGPDTAENRSEIRHFLKLRDFINQYEKEQFCINLGDLAYGDKQLDLTDDRVLELLRQFVFFTLQSHHPLQAYKKTNPTAPQFISRLERNPLGEPKFTQFMDTYQKNKLPVPQAIARVLASTKLRPDAQKQEIDRLVQQELFLILKFLRDSIPSSDPFWKNVRDPNDPKSIIDALLTQKSDTSRDVSQLTSKITTLESEKKACEDAKAALQKQKDDIDKKLLSANAMLEGRAGKEKELADLQVAAAKAKADCDRRIAELEKDKAALQVRLNRQNELLTSVQSRASDQQAALRDLQRQIREMQTAAAGATRQINEAQRGRTAAEKAQKTAQTSLAEAQTRISERDGQLATLTAQKNTLEANVERIQEELSATKGQRDTAAAEQKRYEIVLAQLQEELNFFEQDQAEIKKESSQEIERLKRGIATLQAKLKDTLAAKKECEERERSLIRKSGEGGAAIAAIEGQLSALRTENEGLTANVARLETELRNLTTTTRANIGAATERAREAEAARAGLEAQVATANEEASRQKTAATAATQAKDVSEAQKAELAGEVASLTTALGQRDAALEKSQSDLAMQRDGFRAEMEEKNELLGMLQSILSQMVSSPSEDIGRSIDAVKERGIQASLFALLPKLLGRPRSLSEQKFDRTTAQCFNVFMLTYLWNRNFPSYKTNQFYLLLNKVFSGGKNPTNTTGRAVIAPLIEAGNVPLMRSYLGLFQKLSGILPVFADNTIKQPPIYPIELTAEESKFLVALLSKIDEVERAHDRQNLSKLSAEHFVTQNPELREEEFSTKFLKLEGSIISLVDDPQPLNFALLFYSYLIVLRDQLNFTKAELGTCPLPSQLDLSVP
jgi:hypothetical protein